MKKLILVACCSILLSGCGKKEQQPQPESPQQLAENLQQPVLRYDVDGEFKYRSEIRVYDKTGKFYIDFEVKSNDEVVYQEGRERVGSYSLELGDKVKEHINQEGATAEHLTALEEKAPLVIVFKNVSIGDAKIADLIPSNTSDLKQSDVITTSWYWSFYQLPQPAGEYIVTNMVGATYWLTAEDYMWQGGAWVRTYGVTLPPTWSNTFQTGYANRMLAHHSNVGFGGTTLVGVTIVW